MKILRYTYNDACEYSVLQEDKVRPILGDIFTTKTSELCI